MFTSDGTWTATLYTPGGPEFTGTGDGIHKLVQELGQQWLDSQTPEVAPG
jgi:hypothetical protein